MSGVIWKNKQFLVKLGLTRMSPNFYFVQTLTLLGCLPAVYVGNGYTLPPDALTDEARCRSGGLTDDERNTLIDLQILVRCKALAIKRARIWSEDGRGTVSKLLPY